VPFSHHKEKHLAPFFQGLGFDPEGLGEFLGALNQFHAYEAMQGRSSAPTLDGALALLVEDSDERYSNERDRPQGPLAKPRAFLWSSAAGTFVSGLATRMEMTAAASRADNTKTLARPTLFRSSGAGASGGATAAASMAKGGGGNGRGGGAATDGGGNGRGGGAADGGGNARSGPSGGGALGSGASSGGKGGGGKGSGSAGGSTAAPGPVGRWFKTSLAGGSYVDGLFPVAVSPSHFELRWGTPKVSAFFHRVTLEKIIVNLGYDPAVYNLTWLVAPVSAWNEASKYVAVAGGGELPIGQPVSWWFRDKLAKPALDMTKTPVASVPKYFQ
jgi:hypothetical protein